MEGGFQQGFPVSGGAGAADARAGGQLLPQLCQSLLGRFDGISLVVGIIGEQQLPFPADQSNFGGGGACVNTQEAIPLVSGEFRFPHHRPAVPQAECLVFLPASEQRRQPFDLKGHLHTGIQRGDQITNCPGLSVVRLKSRAHGGEQMGIGRIDGGFRGQPKRPDKRSFQLRQKMERPPKNATRPRMGLPQARPEMVWLTTA